MGCGESKPKITNSGKGFIPKKIESTKNNNVFIQDIVYLFGGSKVLQFDTKTMRISEVNPQPNVKLPKRTQCEYIRDLKKIVTLGGIVDGKPTTVGYLFDPTNFANPTPLPPFPKPVRYTTLAYFNGVLYAVGGETTAAGSESESILPDVWSLRLAGSVGSEWEKVCDLPIRRRSANVVVANNQIYVFGGYSGDKLRSTQIDRIDINTKQAFKEDYRLPFGVEGARLCWHGDKILMIGGKRFKDRPDSNVLLLNFKKKWIMSMR